jgi:hypothetical protein
MLVDILDWVDLHLSVKSSKQQSADPFKVFEKIYYSKVSVESVLIVNDLRNLISLLFHRNQFKKIG